MDMPPQSTFGLTQARTPGGNRAFHNFANDVSHVQDPNLRRRLALSEIDKAPFGLNHVRAVAVAGVGFFLNSYDMFAMNLITTLLGVVFWSGAPTDARNGYGGNDGALPTSASLALRTSTSAGIIVGQLCFGFMADVLGRRKMYGVELVVIVLSTLGCALVSPSQSVGFTGLMAFWRVMMGFGIGGDYPLSSVVTSEFAPTRWRGAMIAAVFSMQGLGQLAAAVVALIATAAFKDAFLSAPNASLCDSACQLAADRSWRIVVGVGAVPACFALYYRLTIPETPRYSFEVARDVDKADADVRAYVSKKPEGETDEVRRARNKLVATSALDVPRASWPDFCSYFGSWKNARVLAGTTMSWFFLDFAFYGLVLNNSIVLRAIGYANGDSLYRQLHNNALGLIIMTIAGSIPGYAAAVLTIDTIGRKPLQVFGFLAVTIILAVLGFCHDRLSQGAAACLYILAHFFLSWGPSATAFVVPAECFPTRYRATAHGLSAAAGQVGAILAQVVVPVLLLRSRGGDSSLPADCPLGGGGGTACSPPPWLAAELMRVFALSAFCGAVASLLIPETKGVTLEELAGEGAGAPPPFEDVDADADAEKKWWWSPFTGGRAAGFRNCVDDEAVADPTAGVGSGGGGGGEKRRSRSQGCDDGHEMGSSVGPTAAAAETEKETGKETVTVTGMGMGCGSRNAGGSSDALVEDGMPSWAAGWGRVDLGMGPPPLENSPLQDVGNLLKC